VRQTDGVEQYEAMKRDLSEDMRLNGISSVIRVLDEHFAEPLPVFTRAREGEVELPGLEQARFSQQHAERGVARNSDFEGQLPERKPRRDKVELGREVTPRRQLVLEGGSKVCGLFLPLPHDGEPFP